MSPLPDFETPPVREVVCSVTYKYLDGFLVAHLGQLWEKFRDEYPKCEEKEPLGAVFEKLDAGGETERNVRLLTVPPMPRVWFSNEDDTRLIQVQRDRFIHNWKKMRDDDDYPRYPKVMKMFRTAFEHFEEFLAEQELGVVESMQYELTYVNYIARHEGWENCSDIGTLFPDFAWRNESRFLPEPESNDWRLTFPLPGNAGRLHVRIQKAFRNTDQQEIMRMDLTARGIGENKSGSAMYEWFDMAREWIVCGFVDLTGERPQREHWGMAP